MLLASFQEGSRVQPGGPSGGDGCGIDRVRSYHLLLDIRPQGEERVPGPPPAGQRAEGVRWVHPATCPPRPQACALPVPGPSFPAMDGSIRREILAAFEGSRTKLSPVDEVRARPYVSRLASLSPGRTHPRGSPPTRVLGQGILNLSTAVVEAGPEAWSLVAPALEGDRESLRRLRELTRGGVEANRVQKGRRTGRTGPGALPNTPCEGTPDERRYLLYLYDFMRSTSGSYEALSGEIQLRISQRMTARLGLFSHRGSTRRITISRRLFQPGLEAILWDTVKHELAHLADHATNPDGRTSHGPRWKAWARRLGARPERLCTAEEARLLRRRGSAPARGPGTALRYPPEVERWLAEGSVRLSG